MLRACGPLKMDDRADETFLNRSMRYLRSLPSSRLMRRSRLGWSRVRIRTQARETREPDREQRDCGRLVGQR
jgi:hypothetical protein